MQYKTLRKISTIFLMLFTLLTIFLGIAYVGGREVLISLDLALEEMLAIENNTAPALSNASRHSELKMWDDWFKDSDEIRLYITDVEKSMHRSYALTGTFFYLSVAALIARIYFSKKMRNNN